MKKLLLLFFFFSAYCSAQDQRIWATYYGGEDRDFSENITTDKWSNVYLVGHTLSDTGIEFHGFQNTNHGEYDAFLVKYNSSGNRLWATYFGGDSIDYGYSVATDTSGNVYIAGDSRSFSDIDLDGFQNNYGGGYVDAFLVKYDSTGNREWATYYGGTSIDHGKCITTDLAGNVYLAGSSSSDSGIAVNGHQNELAGIQDAYLVKFDTEGNRLWGTYYGGVSSDFAYAVNTDKQGNVYIAGYTNSISGISTSNGYQNTLVGDAFDAFIVKFDSYGNRIWATYYGGEGDDFANFLVTDNEQNVYLAGNTKSTTNIAFEGFQNYYAGGSAGDAFLVKFDSLGNRIWGTYYGGVGSDRGFSVATDSLGNVFLAGDVSASNTLAFEGFQDSLYFSSVFLVKFDKNGNRQCATYYGFGYMMNGHLALDKNNNVYLSGSTRSTSDISSNGFQNTYGGGTHDGFLVKFTNCDNCAESFSIHISNSGDTLIASTNPNYQWYFNDTLILGATNQTYQITENGQYYVITTQDSCTLSSNIIEVTCLCVGIAEYELAKQIFLYPNPASGYITVRSHLISKTTQLSAFNAQGQQVFAPLIGQSDGQANLYVGHLASGVYTLTLTNKEQSVSKRFVKE